MSGGKTSIERKESPKRQLSEVLVFTIMFSFLYISVRVTFSIKSLVPPATQKNIMILFLHKEKKYSIYIQEIFQLYQIAVKLSKPSWIQ